MEELKDNQWRLAWLGRDCMSCGYRDAEKCHEGPVAVTIATRKAIHRDHYGLADVFGPWEYRRACGRYRKVFGVSASDDLNEEVKG